MIKKFFQFEQRNTSYRIETMAGMTTFLSVAYILIVNPLILSETGMDKGAVFTATALTAIFGTLMIGLLANYPIAIAPSMGLNSFFTFSVSIGMGIPWEVALTAVFIAGVIFTILSLTKVRELMIEIIPQDLKYAIASGIGFFIAFIGLRNAGIIIPNEDTFVSLGNLTEPTTLLAIFGLIITVILLLRGLKGGIFYGMVCAILVGMVFGLIEFPKAIIGEIPSVKPTFGAVFMNFHLIFSPELFAVIFTFLFVAFFDTAGALIGLTSQAQLMKDNEIPRLGRALVSDSLASVFGSIVGTSTPATSIESSAGISVGGRTGFTSVVIAFLFFASLFFYPLLDVIITEATAPALMIVGSFMAQGIRHIQWNRLEVAIPAFLTILMMPLTSSVATGIAFGLIFHPLCLIAQKKTKEIHPLLYLFALLFIIYFIFAAS